MNNNIIIKRNVDDEIFEYMDIDAPKSFFLFAGAGSGKTRSLVTVLNRFQEVYGVRMSQQNKKVAIITYTNAACDEITRRLDFNALFSISTIHSFVWQLIKPFQRDIKDWVRKELIDNIEQAQEKVEKSKTGTSKEKALKKLEQYQKELEVIDGIKSFSYDPNAKKNNKGELNHSQVIKMGATFISSKSLLRKIFAQKYPILFIDESQDTNKNLIDALFILQKEYQQSFCLGLFGDTMQRIYFDGKTNLEKEFPKDWQTPAKTVNYRSPKRVISLINNIRSLDDGREQFPKEGAIEGFVRLYIAESTNNLKDEIEKNVRLSMSNISDDREWISKTNSVKTLTLEHSMAARRMGFIQLFEPLYKQETLKNSLIDGSSADMRFFINTLIPLINAYREKNKFKIASIIKKFSPLFDANMIAQSKQQLTELEKINKIVMNLFSLWNDNNDPIILDVLKYVHTNSLFTLSSKFDELMKTYSMNSFTQSDLDSDGELAAYYEAFINPFSQIEAYSIYISDFGSFGTHQGVKGLEFPRVLAILDDEEANGFMFSYDKLFGTKELTATDKKNILEGKESSIERTRRLFYVICSRAQESLAVMAYSKDPSKLVENVLEQKMFEVDEVFIWNQESKSFFELDTFG